MPAVERGCITAGQISHRPVPRKIPVILVLKRNSVDESSVCLNSDSGKFDHRFIIVFLTGVVGMVT